MFEAVEKDLLPHKIVNSLLALIQKKQLLPGERLPPERELAQMMNVSRPSLRAALQVLATMNVLEIHPGSGAYVSRLEPDRLVQHLDFIFALDDASIFQLFDARRTLELRTVALAAQCITAAELAALEGSLTAWDVASNDDLREEADREFHKQIAAAAQNPILYRFVSIVTQLGKVSRCRSYGLPNAIDKTRQEHWGIVEALRARDEGRAQQAMLAHLQGAETYLRQLVAEEE
ncbi:MAG: FadR family transcriptional regulator [Caldilineaceae bacterium]|nr:FadR family transcriptional regulator [Caldilineaceae bacterium]